MRAEIITIEGKDYMLRFDINTLCLMESKGIDPMELMGDMEHKSLTKMRQLFYFGLLKFHKKGMTEEKAGELISAFVEDENEENTYAVFWEDLCSLSECTSNQTLRKLIAKEILAQILQHVSQFCKASVPEEEIWQMIQLIEREIPELESEIQKGKEIITLVYQMGE